MKKKVWIRLVGVLALVLWAVTVNYFRAGMMTRDIALGGTMALMGMLSFAAAGFVTFVWALFSVIDWALRRAAKLRMAELQMQAAGETLRRSSAIGRPPERAPGPPAPAPSKPLERRGNGVMTSPLGLS